MEIEEQLNKQEELDKNSEKELVADLTNNESESIGEKQNKFLESTFGRVINTGIDVALRAILPNAIENEVIRNKKCNYE